MMYHSEAMLRRARHPLPPSRSPARTLISRSSSSRSKSCGTNSSDNPRSVPLLDQLELHLPTWKRMPHKPNRGAAGGNREYHRAIVRPRKPARRPLPEHLPRERIVYPSPLVYPCCGDAVAQDRRGLTETLELIPRQWKVIQHVREKFSCRSCEALTSRPRPHTLSRARADPKLLAHILFAKYACTSPSIVRATSITQTSPRCLTLTTGGAAAATLIPLVDVSAPTSLPPSASTPHTTVPVLTKAKPVLTAITYVRYTVRSPSHPPHRSSIRGSCAASRATLSGYAVNADPHLYQLQPLYETNRKLSILKRVLAHATQVL